MLQQVTQNMPTSAFLGEMADSNKSNSHRECLDPNVDTRPRGPWVRFERAGASRGSEGSIKHSQRSGRCVQQHTGASWESVLAGAAAAREVTWRAGGGGGEGGFEQGFGGILVAMGDKMNSSVVCSHVPICSNDHYKSVHRRHHCAVITSAHQASADTTKP